MKKLSVSCDRETISANDQLPLQPKLSDSVGQFGIKNLSQALKGMLQTGGNPTLDVKMHFQ